MSSKYTPPDPRIRISSPAEASARLRAEPWTISTALALGIALVMAGAGVVCIYAGLANFADNYGIDRSPGVLLLLFGFGALLASGLALTFARARLIQTVGWLLTLLIGGAGK